jgi:hypothetical protein
MRVVVKGTFLAVWFWMLLLPLVAGTSWAQQPQARDGDPQFEAPQAEAQYAQDPKAAPTAEARSWIEQFRKRHPDLAEVMDLAEMAPPELRAKALITIANAPELKTEEWKRNILLEAFDSASLAHDPLPHFVVYERFVPYANEIHDVDFEKFLGSRTLIQSEMSREKVDRLSLQAAAINALLAFDVSAAKELYLRMPPLAVERLSCDDALVPDPSQYYELLGKIVQSGFSPEERRAGRHVVFLRDQIQAMTSPMQLEPMSRLLRSASLTREDYGSLIAQYTDVLDHMDADDRSFTVSLAGFEDEMLNLVKFAVPRKTVCGPLVAAYRSYLSKGFTGERCTFIPGQDFGQRLAIRHFNAIFGNDHSGSAALAPLLTDDLRPAKVLGDTKFEPLDDSPEAQDFVRTIAKLTEEQNTRDDSDEGKKQQEEQFDRLVRFLDDMQALPGEDDEHYLLRKGEAFSFTLSTLPPGPKSKKLIGPYVDFLNSAANSSSLLTWLPALRGLLVDSPSFEPESKKRMLNVLAQSGSPALKLYARLQLMSENHAPPREPEKDNKLAPER